MTRHRARPRPPLAIAVLAAIGALLFVTPLLGLLWRMPWSRAGDYLVTNETLTALRLSLLCSLAATAVSLVCGVPLAWILARLAFPGRAALRAMCTLSMVLPPVVGGVALFYALGRRGLVGQWLYRWFGYQMPFSATAVVVAQAFVAMPFLVLTVEAALRQSGTDAEDAARTLGAGRWYTFRHVTLPGVRPALVAGAVLAWARALGEFGATITFAGNLPGSTQTVPIAVYLAREVDPQRALVLSVLMVAISFLVLVALRDHWFGTSRGQR